MKGPFKLFFICLLLQPPSIKSNFSNAHISSKYNLKNSKWFAEGVKGSHIRRTIKFDNLQAMNNLRSPPQIDSKAMLTSNAKRTPKRVQYLEQAISKPNKPRIRVFTSFYDHLLLTSDIFVDKSLLITELINNPKKVTVISRPRRTGKSLNTRMTRLFLGIEIRSFVHDLLPDEERVNYKLFVHGEVLGDERNKTLRRKLKIAAYQEFISRHQGQYPVLYFDAHNLELLNRKRIEVSIANELAENYEDYLFGLKFDELNETQDAQIKKYFTRIINQEDIENSLRFFSELISKRYNRKVYVLIEEPQSPIYIAYCKYGAQSEQYTYVSQLLRNMFHNVLHNNPYLEKAIIHTPLPVLEADYFSHLGDDVAEYTVLDPEYSKFYGFTQEEVDEMFKKVPTMHNPNKIKSWFNCYNQGNTVLYNSRAIMLCLSRNGSIANYWSCSICPTDSISKGAVLESVQHELDWLLQGKYLVKALYRKVSFQEVEQGGDMFYSSLVHEGFLNAVPIRDAGTEKNRRYYVMIPNEDAKEFFLEAKECVAKNKSMPARQYD